MSVKSNGKKAGSTYSDDEDHVGDADDDDDGDHVGDDEMMMMVTMWAGKAGIPTPAIIGSQGSDPLHYIEHRPLC